MRRFVHSHLAVALAGLLCRLLWLTVSCAETNSVLDEAAAKAEVRRALIGDYENTPGDFQNDRLLAVAISYAKEQKYDQARVVYESFLKAHPQHPRALRGLGTVCVLQEPYSAATNYLRQAWALGDLDSLFTLAAAYVKSTNYAGMEDLIPHLLKHKTGPPEVVNYMVAFALSKDAKQVKLLLEARENCRSRPL